MLGNIRLILIKSTLVAIIISFSWSAFGLPVDVQGKVVFDSNTIKSFRRTNTSYNSSNDGTQQIPPAAGNYETASYQSYILRLNPSIIINDSATFFGEITTGHSGGGFFGDSALYKKNTVHTYGDALFLQNTSSDDPNLLLSQFYLKFYADTATYIIGRQKYHWALGALYNEGKDVLDRYTSIRDGVTVNFKIQNFLISPYWAKINSLSNLTKSPNTKSYGITLLYQNLERDLTFGILYGKKSAYANNTFYRSGEGHTMGRAKVKITDLFFKKTFGNFTFAVEVPILTGDLGNVYSPSGNTKYKAHAVIGESSYKLTDVWNLGLSLGHITGEDGRGPSYGALYLNPNYQIANILFRYNLYAVADNDQSIYDSYMVNAKYAKLSTDYQMGSWNFSGAFIYALANETAKPGEAFNHSKNKQFTATQTQKDDLGYEIDLGLDYKWDDNIRLHSSFGYLVVGDYFTFTNTETPVKKHDTYSLLFGISTVF